MTVPLNADQLDEIRMEFAQREAERIASEEAVKIAADRAAIDETLAIAGLDQHPHQCTRENKK